MIKLSLKNKLLFSIFFTIIFFGVIANYYVYIKSKNIILETAIKKLELIDSEKGHVLEHVLSQGENLSITLSGRAEIVNYLSNSPKPQNDKMLNFLKGLNVDGSYLNIYIIASDGIALASSDPASIGNDYSSSGFFRKALDGKQYTEASIGIYSNKLGYYFSYPVKNFEGIIIGVIAVKMDPEYVHRNIHLDGTSGEMSIMLADTNGIIIYSSDKARVFKSLGALTKEKLKLINEKNIFPGIKTEPLKYDLAMKQLSGTKNSSIISFYDELDKEEELLIITKIPFYPFYIISEHSLEEFISSSISLSYGLSIFVALAALAALIIIVYFVNKFLKPLALLDKGVHKIGKGDLDYQIKIKTKDELQRLAGHVNDMAKKIKQSQSKTKKELFLSKKINKIMIGRELEMKKLKKENDELRRKCNE